MNTHGWICALVLVACGGEGMGGNTTIGSTGGEATGEGPTGEAGTSTADDPVLGPEDCGDGVVVPGSLCFAVSELVDGTPAKGFHDLDLDGHLDLLMGGDHGLAVYRGGGDGSLVGGEILGDPIDNVGLAVGVGDFNGDGVRDAVELLGGMFSLIRVTTEGGVMETLYLGPSGSSFAIEDFDGDGLSDVVTAVGPLLRHYRGDAGGDLPQQPPVGIGGEARDVAVLDVDGDLDIDVITANSGTNDLSLLRNDGTGQFAAQEVIPVGPRPFAIRVADIDGDGRLDLVVVMASGIELLRGLAGGVFAAPTYTPVFSTFGLYPSFQAAWPAVCELDGDEYPDVALAWRNNGSGRLLVFRGGPSGLAAAEIVQEDTFAMHVICGDLNEDGLGDLLFTTKAGDGRNPARLLLSAP